MIEIAGISPELKRAQEIFAEEWKKRHPATPPPAPGWYRPTPEQASDPLWREAEALREQAEHQAHAEALSSPANTQAWSAFVMYVMCPNSHSVANDAQFCPECGLQVPPTVAVQSQEMTRRANESAMVGLWRSGF